MKITTELFDTDGNEIPESARMCKCGKVADGCIMTDGYICWICNECLFGKKIVKGKKEEK